MLLWTLRYMYFLIFFIYICSYNFFFIYVSVVQSLSCVLPHELQHIRLPCLSLSPRVCSNSCPLSQWCQPSILSSVTQFFSGPQSCPASGAFPINQLFPSGGQSVRVSTSASAIPMNIQDWFPLGLTGLISLLSKGVSRVFFSITVQKHQLFFAQLSHPYTATWKTTALTIRRLLSAKWCRCFLIYCLCFVIASLSRNKHLLILQLTSPSSVILEPKEIKSLTGSIVSPSACHEVMGLDAMIFIFECCVQANFFTLLFQFHQDAL